MSCSGIRNCRNYIYATGKIGTMVLEDSMVHLAY